ncbi:hypothetical protein DERP_001566 [Dermatophagoides pteronyssinus]|uniref:Uncharacterized protein n=2 Tax=Dermatophagoides pteronyssinus TaxID=6956 RepID=A0ABQ8JAW3_DERPT|nr:hypothetical protein DERP_001566 [Dermatophagoides pteronyssinus]
MENSNTTKLNDILKRSFYYLKYYSLRLEYSIEDYNERKILKTLKTFQRSIWITINNWISIGFLILIIFFNNNNHLIINIERIELMTKSNRLDLLFLELLIIFSLLELLWIFLFKMTLNYRCSLHMFANPGFQSINNVNYLNNNDLQQLVKSFITQDHIVILISRIINSTFIILNLYMIIYSYRLYQNDEINLKKLLFTTLMFYQYCRHICYMLGQLFFSVRILVLFVDLLRLRLLSLLRSLILTIKRQKFQSILIIKKIHLNYFQYRYVCLYKETIETNYIINTILFVVEMISKSAIIMSCIFYERQLITSTFNMASVLALFSTFILTTLLNLRVSLLPTSNKQCTNFLLCWLARTQFIELKNNNHNENRKNFHLKQRLNNIRSTLRSNQFVQIMNNNRFGFSCGHLYFIDKFIYIRALILNFHLIIKFYKKICIKKTTTIIKIIRFSTENELQMMDDIFIEGFENFKTYSFRLNYSLSDYRNRNIHYSYQTIKRTIWMTLNAWIVLMILFATIYFENNPYILDYHHLDRIFNIENIKILLIGLFFCYIILEYLWLHLFRQVINYRSSINNFFINNIPFDSKKLQTDSLTYLKKLYSITNFLAKLSNQIVMISLIIIYFLFIFIILIFYAKDQINLAQILYSIPNFGFLAMHIINMMGQLFIDTNFILFLVEFFHIRMKHLLMKSISASNSYHLIIKQNGINKTRLFWNKFHNEYLKLFTETIRFNPTLSFLLFILDIISKGAIIVAILFYSRQTHLNLFSTTSIMIMLMTFFYPIILYSRVSRLPTCNQLCTKYLLNWLARTQWLILKQNDRKILINKKSYQKISRYSFKSNLFIQIMNNNRFGFTCGHLFFITKFKYIQLLLLNINLIIKFYKKIIHSSQK